MGITRGTVQTGSPSSVKADGISGACDVEVDIHYRRKENQYPCLSEEDMTNYGARVEHLYQYRAIRGKSEGKPDIPQITYGLLIRRSRSTGSAGIRFERR